MYVYDEQIEATTIEEWNPFIKAFSIQKCQMIVPAKQTTTVYIQYVSSIYEKRERERGIVNIVGIINMVELLIHGNRNPRPSEYNW